MLKSILEAKPGDVITFVYDGGSNPGSTRLVKVIEIHENYGILAEDLDDFNLQKTFLAEKAHKIYIQSSCHSVSFIITSDNNISLYLDNKVYFVSKDHQSYKEILNILNEDTYTKKYDQLLNLVNIVKPVQNFIGSQAEIRNGEIYYQGSVLHNCLADRVLELYQGGFPFKPMLNFLERIMQNPSKRAVDELYKFLEHKNLPITEDGCFIAYKKVTEDYKDYHSRSFNNSIGSVNEMPRNNVCDDFNVTCSKGFHVGSLYYATQEFAANEGRVVLVKVDPADAVSVPKDCKQQKLRVCKYEVIAELPPEEYQKGLQQPIYSEEYEDDDYDDDYYYEYGENYLDEEDEDNEEDYNDYEDEEEDEVDW
jgi:hypothetical protein